MAAYKTPGVYVEEISKLPPSVAQVETAVPVFIGYTQNTSYNGINLVYKPTKIKSLKEYEEIFGGAKPAVLTVSVVGGELSGNVTFSTLEFRMYYSLQMYFANGGGPCYISSAGAYPNTVVPAEATTALSTALTAVQKEDEPTMILIPDAHLSGEAGSYSLYSAALAQSALLMDRVTIIDLFSANGTDTFASIESTFRTSIGNNFLSYGAAYYPYLRTQLNQIIDETTQAVVVGSDNFVMRLPDDAADLSTSLYHQHSKLYFNIKKSMDRGDNKIILPPSSAVAGVYCQVDANRGVWKAPANVSLNMVLELMQKIDDYDQQDMNVTGTGKSVNAIREFMGKGKMVWGARTLAGNDNEWRYISVRRFYNMVEESVKKSTEPFVFEPNDANTWSKVKGMIENFLTLQWRAGALQGAKTDDAFYVSVGLGSTMTALDILEGRMIVEIGMAVVRPAEFIILRFSHLMAKS